MCSAVSDVKNTKQAMHQARHQAMHKTLKKNIAAQKETIWPAVRKRRGPLHHQPSIIVRFTLYIMKLLI
jgi:hypothetical protein